MLILGIESSCDETAASVIGDCRTIRSSVISTQIEEHRKYGGVVPEIASRRHCENILGVTRKALGDAGVTLKDGSMYPIMYRMIDKGLITDKQVLVGKRRTRVYYSLTDEGKQYLEEIKAEYFFITEGISNILNYQEASNEDNG